MIVECEKQKGCKMKKVLVLLSVCASLSCIAAETQNLAVQYALKTDDVIKIDGKLDEAAWKKAPEFTDYRFVNGPMPKKTSLRILWGKHGIYLGVVNYERKGYSLRTTVRTRDGGHIWADDSGEFYIDPFANGYSMFKFDVNSVGAIYDFWQVDPGNIDTSYRSPSAVSASQILPDRWTIEFFVSYADMQVKRPEAGSIWAIMHRRLAYTEGPLIDLSTSGGNFNNRRFGYVFMTENGSLPRATVLAQLKRYASAPWLAKVGNEYFWTDGKSEISGSGKRLVTYFKGILNKEMKKLNAAQKKNMQKKIAQIKDDSVNSVIALTKLIDEVKAFQQRNQLNALFE